MGSSGLEIHALKTIAQPDDHLEALCPRRAITTSEHVGNGLKCGNNRLHTSHHITSHSRENTRRKQLLLHSQKLPHVQKQPMLCFLYISNSNVSCVHHYNPLSSSAFWPDHTWPSRKAQYQPALPRAPRCSHSHRSQPIGPDTRGPYSRSNAHGF